MASKENLHLILTSDLVDMLSTRTDAYAKMTADIKNRKSEILQLEKLIEWRKLTVTSIHSSLDSPLVSPSN